MKSEIGEKCLKKCIWLNRTIQATEGNMMGKGVISPQSRLS